MPYYYPMMDWYPYMGFGMSLIWIIVILIIAYFVYKLIKNERAITPKAESAEDILAKRYAKGELTKEQYVQMKEDLKKV